MTGLGGPTPEKPSLANGFIDPNEIADLDVTVFVGHGHPDHFDPVIFSWEGIVKKIRYVFGWKAREGPRIVPMAGPRATKTIGRMEIFTVNSDHNQIPEVGYLVKVDGLAILHPGDYMGRPDRFLPDMDYLKKVAGRIDLEFVNLAGGQAQMEILKPRAAFPMHAFGREYIYGAAARGAKERGLRTRIVASENRGDNFLYKKGKIKAGR
ncbi:MAG: hypothetical protein E4H17_03805 [Gemmatimonadales bacterium]|nr:MAG: hypothetical protein E4H17_03805 [Gemmatimonadales bacterium]